ncbi:ABC transporter ATP-binding protein [Rhodoferax aquaticus]|uniref:Spermidine/putrescine import ATP-binding protein PotA n=1 Tax=Rhodoferax aquaticus TaxID=2527691 RepID=A0A515EJK7_9BURK|nr:ABC transporter ATP-binding protein [Rhodoferax aquaticus]QDL52830.1 ABC transporter ATP-binding protein [Rhodoferax aquaticus]
MAFLEISHLKKHFGSQTAVKDFSISVEKGEFITFLGPSGCGKTTILRMLAGFEAPSEGSIVFDGKDVTHLRTNQRNVGMVFQSYALFPNMTVAENIGFGLKVANMPQAQIDARVKEMLALIKLDTLAARYPWQMSGGQQQRVALARAIANKPKVLLLDEPLSALDAKIRVSLREEIRVLQRELNITTVFVTHDQEEALSISDRIVVLNEGSVEQIGTPSEIYNFPRTRFVASFVGTLNQLHGTVVDVQAGTIQVGDQILVSTNPVNGLTAGQPCVLAIRPEAIQLNAPSDGKNMVQATVEDVSFLGSIVRIRTRVGSDVISFDVFNDPNQTLPARGVSVSLSFAYENLLILK